MRSLVALEAPWALLWLAVPAVVYLVHRAVRARSGACERRPTAPWLRVAATLLLVLSLSGLQVASPNARRSLLFVLDSSESVSPTGAARALARVRGAMASMDEGDRAGLVVFAGNALVERRLTGDSVLDPLRSTPRRTATDVATALRLAAEVGAEAPGRRIVLLSDGHENQGQALEAALAIAATGTPIDVVPLDDDPRAAELAMAAVTGPPTVRRGEPFELGVELLTSGPVGDLEVTLLRAGSQVDRSTVAAPAAGRHRLSFPRVETEAGTTLYTVRVLPTGDPGAEPAHGGRVVEVIGPPRAACLCGPLATSRLGAALGDSYTLEVLTYRESMLSLGAFDRWQVVIVDDPLRTDLENGLAEALVRYATSAGGGLVLIGGERSFRADGLPETALAEALPVEIGAGGSFARSPIDLLLLIDRSGSMAREADGLSKLDAARQASAAIAERLGSGDRVGVLAFSTEVEVIAPLGPPEKLPQTLTRLGKIAAGGGTAIGAAVEAATARLARSAEGRRRHLLLISDGQNDSGEVEGLEALLVRRGVVLSAVGVGDHADRQLLERLAASSGGRAEFTRDPGRLAELVAREGRRIAGRRRIEGRFRPRRGEEHPITVGLTDADLPKLDGYMASRLKSAARAVLVSDSGDPVLAAWPVGLGRVATLTAGLGPDPEDGLIADRQALASVLARTVRWATRRPERGRLAVRVALEGSDARIAADLVGVGGGWSSTAAVRAAVAGLGQEVRSVELVPTAPGRYEGSLSINRSGLHRIAVTATEADGIEERLVLGLDASTLDEHRAVGAATELLARVADLTGGSILGPEATLLPEAPTGSRFADASGPLAIAGLLLFVGEIVWRRRSRARALQQYAPRPARPATGGLVIR